MKTAFVPLISKNIKRVNIKATDKPYPNEYFVPDNNREVSDRHFVPKRSWFVNRSHELTPPNYIEKVVPLKSSDLNNIEDLYSPEGIKNRKNYQQMVELARIFDNPTFNLSHGVLDDEGEKLISTIRATEKMEDNYDTDFTLGRFDSVFNKPKKIYSASGRSYLKHYKPLEDLKYSHYYPKLKRASAIINTFKAETPYEENLKKRLQKAHWNVLYRGKQLADEMKEKQHRKKRLTNIHMNAGDVKKGVYDYVVRDLDRRSEAELARLNPTSEMDAKTYDMISKNRANFHDVTAKRTLPLIKDEKYERELAKNAMSEIDADKLKIYRRYRNEDKKDRFRKEFRRALVTDGDLYDDLIRNFAGGYYGLFDGEPYLNDINTQRINKRIQDNKYHNLKQRPKRPVARDLNDELVPDPDIPNYHEQNFSSFYVDKKNRDYLSDMMDRPKNPLVKGLMNNIYQNYKKVQKYGKEKALLYHRDKENDRYFTKLDKLGKGALPKIKQKYD